MIPAQALFMLGLGEGQTKVIAFAQIQFDPPIDFNIPRHLVKQQIQVQLRTLQRIDFTHFVCFPTTAFFLQRYLAPAHGVQGSYDYDPLDAVTGVSGEQRFYQDGKLATQITDSDTSSFMHGANTVLAEQKAGADPKS